MAQMEAQQRRPNVVIYSTVINACEKAAKWTQALCLLTAAGTSSVEIDVILCTAAMGSWVSSEGGIDFFPFHPFPFLRISVLAIGFRIPRLGVGCLVPARLFMSVLQDEPA